MKYCPLCASLLTSKEIDGKDRFTCLADSCSFIYWNNPIPVVCIIAETKEGIVLANNVTAPPGVFSVISGFLEASEEPQEAAVRELKEELGLRAEEVNFLGANSFAAANQILLTYHIKAQGDITLNEELRDFKIVQRNELNGYKESGKFELKKWTTELKVLAD